MSNKQPKINDTLNEARTQLEAGEFEEAKATLEQLEGRRITKIQQAALEELQSAIEEHGEEETYTMSKQLQKYRARYKPSITAKGTKSLNNGDPIAQLLEGKEWEEVCKLADEILGEPAGHHATKYANLNPGQRRMNSGNRIRAAWKRGEFDPEQAVA